MTDPFAVQTLAEWLHKSTHAVAFTGAGISTASGIPDFRSEHNGLWADADAMQVASIMGFKQNPTAFYRWVRPLATTILAAHPNAAHYALAQFEAQGVLKSVITQNIDMLHTRAGSQAVRELHGHLREMTCIRCYTPYDAEPLLKDWLQTGNIPLCVCGGVLKPNVILFGEQLPYKALQDAQADVRQCDLLIVIGSSLEVEPASSLPGLAKRNRAKVAIINLQTTFFDANADLVIHDDAAVILPAVMRHYQRLANE